MPAQSQTRSGNAVWLLAYRLGGSTYRFATEPVEVLAASGATTRWAEGLGSFDGALPRSATSAAVSIAGGSVDWAELQARGLDLASGRATLYRWFPGQKLEEAEVLLEGNVDDPEWGDIDEAFEFSLIADPWREQSVVPVRGMTIDATTWPVQFAAGTTGANVWSIDEPALGAMYPIPIGRPGAAGWDGLGTLQRAGGAITAVPAYLVEYSAGAQHVNNSRLLIAGCDIQADQVLIFDASDGKSEFFAVNYTTDLQGRRVAYVSPGDGTVVRPWTGHEYYSSFGPGRGGIWNVDRTDYARGAGEVLAVLYTQLLPRISPGDAMALPIDRGRMLAQRAYLDRFNIDGVMREQMTIHDWVLRNLAPILPIEWVRGPNGWYWLAWRWDATADDVVAELDADAGRVQRASRHRAIGTAQLRSVFRFEYGAGADGGYTRRRVLAPDYDANDDRVRPNLRCWLARSRIQQRIGGSGIAEWAGGSQVVQDDATADRIVEWLAARYATPPTAAIYEGGPELESLALGDVVRLTDSEMYLDSRLALVRDVTPGVQTTVELEILTDPLRAPRRTT